MIDRLVRHARDLRSLTIQRSPLDLVLLSTRQHLLILDGHLLVLDGKGSSSSRTSECSGSGSSSRVRRSLLGT